MGKKYEITNESKIINGQRVYRIEAARDLTLIDGTKVHKGDPGGFIQSEYNLSQDGICWAGENSCICGGSWFYDPETGGSRCMNQDPGAEVEPPEFDGAVVSENAYIFDEVLVSGHAKVYGNAVVFDHVTIFGNSAVHGEACVFNDVKICGSVDISGNAFVFDGVLLLDDEEIDGTTRATGNSDIMNKQSQNTLTASFYKNSDAVSEEKSTAVTFEKDANNTVFFGVGYNANINLDDFVSYLSGNCQNKASSKISGDFINKANLLGLKQLPKPTFIYLTQMAAKNI